jgi:hypothetical protein
MMRFQLAGTLLILIITLPHILLCAAARATTWVVEHDPEIPEDQIGSVVQQASSGDTILVGPGTYYEHIECEDKSLVFIGLEGAASTILDGSREIPGRQGSILHVGRYAATDLVIEGFTLRNGSGSEVRPLPNVTQGGAISCVSHGGTLDIQDCVFESNSVERGQFSNGGGAIYVEWAETTITGCVFRDNRARSYGAAIGFDGSGLLVEDCEFETPEDVARTGGGGAAIFFYGWGPCTIRGCIFTERSSSGSGPMIVVDFEGEIELIENMFITKTSGGRALSFGGLVVTEEHGYSRGVVKNNVFWNQGARNGGIRLSAPAGDMVMSGNTFVGYDVSIFARYGHDSEVSGNIFFESPVTLSAGGGRVSCNDFWPDSLNVASGNPRVEDNIFRNPILCAPEIGDFSISIHSPCAPENSPAGCGLIGAREPACDITPTRRTTWGQLKAKYR